ncbi:lipopolysaccharide heptosyltransferase II [Candidatus Nitronereus thalassa]|uniref:lipopolysaccharide heptosyltransferase II n=1 Tax=Candidatus Nitronereus thalassa TaxID=3020898 RepID=A0ABU3K625_9BACT|nr:lipopolysaccharide heptosyltransferase II [Candidatus Nitronereus thalassa]MDT7041812.1 lipopolysaccharide heptosyltransferase II [Candidatus Nitronereus thalassa]
MLEKLNPDRVRRILVRGPNWVGDAVMCTPALQGIRQTFPSADICLLARPAVAQLLQNHPSVNDTIVYEHQAQHAGLMGRLRLAMNLQTMHFDLAILFPNALDAAILTFLARIPNRYGYATDGRSWLLTDAIPLPQGAKTLHQVHYYEELIRPLCSEYSPQPPLLQVSSDDERQAAELLFEHSVRMNCSILGLNPGSMYGEAKRWLPKRFAQAADQIVEGWVTQEHSESRAQCIIVGAPGEETLGHEIASFMRTTPVVLTGKTSLGALKAVIKQCRVFLTNDTGPMHIANALGVPVVAVFGPTDHKTTAPFVPGYVIVRTPVECSPCLLRECPIDHPCMTGVTVDQVVTATEQVLKTPPVSSLHR